MHPVQQAAEEWEREAIEKTKNDPRIAELGICPVCMVGYPCLCDHEATLQEMREYYEANRRTLFRREPSATGSWGKKIDVLMENLYRIAIARHNKGRKI